MPTTLLSTTISFLIAIALFFLLIPLANRIGLLDSPAGRKAHTGDVPLIGGITIYLTLLIALPIFGEFTTDVYAFLAAAGLLVVVGVIDDRLGIDYKLRIIAEVIAASIMIAGAGVWVGNLGDLIGVGEIHMGYSVGYIFTLVAVFGIVNAINMINGLDGLAAGLNLLSFTVLLLFTNTNNELSIVGPLICGAMVAFLLFNLQLFRFTKRVFLGDAGSTLLGFTLVWFLIEAAKTDTYIGRGIDPVTALYFVAIPLFDMVLTTLRRYVKKQPLFSPDRNHIHHILLDLGFSSRKTLAIILTIDLAIKLVGVIFSSIGVAEYAQFIIFCLLFIGYVILAIRLERRVEAPV